MFIIKLLNNEQRRTIKRQLTIYFMKIYILIQKLFAHLAKKLFFSCIVLFAFKLNIVANRCAGILKQWQMANASPCRTVLYNERGLKCAYIKCAKFLSSLGAKKCHYTSSQSNNGISRIVKQQKWPLLP